VNYYGKPHGNRHVDRRSDRRFRHQPQPHLGLAEQAIRRMVVPRKVWGGNRTVHGAHTQSALVTILQTCHLEVQVHLDPAKQQVDQYD
jgi:ribosomal protein S8E